MEGKFPFTPPKIILRTHIVKPSLSDGRDLLQEIYKKQWTAKNTIFEIITSIPQFLIKNFTDPDPIQF